MREGTARSVLEAFLDDHRALLVSALGDGSEAQARAHLVPSLTILLGLVQQAAPIERFFFQRILAGLAPEQTVGLSDATDVSWPVTDDLTVARALADFEDPGQRSRELAAAFDLDLVTAHNQVRGPMPLRWIYLLVIEELARHAGHAEVLREQLLARRDAPTEQ